jgi:hypothetical protein
MSFVIGRGRYAREAYPTPAGSGGTPGPDLDAVVFHPDPPGTPTSNIRSARDANQSPITGTPLGATNLGSDSTGTTTGVSGEYGTIGGGDQNEVAGALGTIPGGSLCRVFGIAGVACGDEALATADLSVALGGEAFAPGVSAQAIGTGAQAFGSNATALGGSGATGDESVAAGANNQAGSGVFSFSIAAGGTGVSVTGDVTGAFQNADPVTIQPFSPAIGAAVDRTVASVPTFDGTNTTFSISAPIDGTTTAGLIADTNLGAQSAAIGGSGNRALGDASFIGGGTGNVTTVTASSARAGGVLSSPSRVTQDAWASGSDAVVAGNIQTSQLVLSGRTPGSGAGETVELAIDYDNARLPLQLDDGKAYTLRLSVVAAGVIGGSRAVRSFEVETTASQNAGVLAVAASATVTSQGDAAAASWTVTAAPAGAGPTLRLAYTFSTGATTAQVVVAAQTRFTEVPGPPLPP